MNQSTKTNKPLFAKLGHNFANDPKIFTLSDYAFRAYVESLLFSCANMTDGFIDERVAKRFGWDKAAEELTTNDVNSSWQIVDGGWQIYAFSDWQMTSDKHEAIKKVRSDAGKKSGQSRRTNKTRTNDEQVVEQSANKNELEKNRKEKKRIEEKRGEQTPSGYSPEFESWWELYPKKVSKGSAFRAFQSALNRITADELLRLTTRFSESNLPAYEYIPHPATWLNDDRWADQAEPLPRYYHHPPEEDWMYPDEQVANIRRVEAEMRARGEIA